jgi:hypothetical protein
MGPDQEQGSGTPRLESGACPLTPAGGSHFTGQPTFASISISCQHHPPNHPPTHPRHGEQLDQLVLRGVCVLELVNQHVPAAQEGQWQAEPGGGGWGQEGGGWFVCIASGGKGCTQWGQACMHCQLSLGQPQQPARRRAAGSIDSLEAALVALPHVIPPPQQGHRQSQQVVKVDSIVLAQRPLVPAQAQARHVGRQRQEGKAGITRLVPDQPGSGVKGCRIAWRGSGGRGTVKGWRLLGLTFQTRWQSPELGSAPRLRGRCPAAWQGAAPPPQRPPADKGQGRAGGCK